MVIFLDVDMGLDYYSYFDIMQLHSSWYVCAKSPLYAVLITH